jgi:hypothetical protein
MTKRARGKTLTVDELRLEPMNRQHIAYHEAGHAVVTLRLGYKVTEVTIKRDKRAEGRANIIKLGGPTSDGIKIDLAGMIAESLINPTTSFRDQCKNGGRSDWRSALKLARELAFFNETKPGIIIEEFVKRTTALVRQHEQAIANVAAALLERETLTGGEVERLIGRSERSQ